MTLHLLIGFRSVLFVDYSHVRSADFGGRIPSLTSLQPPMCMYILEKAF